MKKTKMLLLIITIIFIQILMPNIVKATDEKVTVKFIDSNLYQSIKLQIGNKVESYSDNLKSLVISETNLKSIKSLSITNKNITSLYGLDKFTELTSLNLSQNNITSVYYLGGLSKLKFLILPNNKITDISSLSRNKELISINLSNNNIKKIDAVANCGDLVTLILNNNEIENISALQNLTKLKTLLLQENKITDMSPINNLNLNIVNLRNQSYEFEIGKVLGNIATNVEIIPFFKQAKEQNSKIYTNSNFTVLNASYNNQTKKIVLKSEISGQRIATVKINGGLADGSILKLKYNNIVLQVRNVEKLPETIYEGTEGTISSLVYVLGEESTNNMNISIYKNNIDVTNQFNITRVNKTINSCNATIKIPNTIQVGTYNIKYKYNGNVAHTESFEIVEKVYAERITLNKQSIELNVNQTEKLIATILPNDTLDKKVYWTSSNENIAKVGTDGTVTAIAEGEATISATTENGKVATCKVNVNIPIIEVESIALNKTTITLNETETFKLIATINPANSTNKEITWTSSNENIAKVGTDGTVTAISKGEAIISVKTQNGKTATCKVTVQRPVIHVESVALNEKTITLNEKQTFQLVATINPGNSTNKEVSWRSINTNVAKVDSNGLVTAISEGITEIIVTAKDNEKGAKQASCVIEVKKVEMIESNKYTIKDKTIYRISRYTTVKELLENIVSNVTCKIYNTRGEQLPNPCKIGTGMKLKTLNSEYELSIIGDLTSDGKTTSTDLLKLKKNIIGTEEFTSDAYQKAADIDNNGKITSTDLLQMKKIIINAE